MQPVGPPPAVQHPAREGVDDAHAGPVRQHGVLHVLLEELPRLDRVEYERRPGPGRVGRLLEEARHAQRPLAVLVPPVRQRHGLVLKVDGVVHPVPEVLGERVRGPVLVRRRGNLLGYDERRPRLVDEDAVRLVDDAEAVELAPPHARGEDGLRGTQCEVVPEVVESELRVGHVDDVPAVLLPPLVLRHARLDEPHGQAEVAVDLAHLLHVPACQVVVHRDDEAALARQRARVRRQGRHERLALAGGHLGEPSVVQYQAAEELNVVVPLLDDAPRRLPDQCEGLLEEGAGGVLPVREAAAELGRLRQDLLVAELLHGRLQGVDPLHALLQRGEVRVVGLLAGLVVPACSGWKG